MEEQVVRPLLNLTIGRTFMAINLTQNPDPYAYTTRARTGPSLGREGPRYERTRAAREQDQVTGVLEREEGSRRERARERVRLKSRKSRGCDDYSRVICIIYVSIL